MSTNKYIIIVVLLLSTLISCAQPKKQKAIVKREANKNMKLEQAVVAGGCFWCVEAQYLMLDGVVKVESGYTGGTVLNPTYKQVCSGTTGHAEAIRITYDASKLSFDDILAAYWQSHDPTTLNRQGNDIGTQYRSAIFFANEAQQKIANAYIEKLNADKVYDNPVVTEVAPLGTYYVAEDYHQNYYNQNSQEGYCKFVIQPKVEKFRKIFKDKLAH